MRDYIYGNGLVATSSINAGAKNFIDMLNSECDLKLIASSKNDDFQWVLRLKYRFCAQIYGNGLVATSYFYRKLITRGRNLVLDSTYEEVIVLYREQ